MATQAATEFNQKLDKLFHDRTHWLRAIVKTTKRGKPPVVDKYKVDATIDDMQQLASECVAEKYAKDEFAALVKKKKQWHVRGWGPDSKKDKFLTWLDEHVTYSNYIYIFWGNNKRCLYVGKTEDGGNRPTAHFEKYWFVQAKRVDIHAVSARTQVLKLECLAKHRFLPIYNKILPPTKLWYKKCPVCEVHVLIHDEMRRIFGLK
jgi:hypothetical protein